MFIDFGMFIKSTLIALGVYWCGVMLGRWRSDLEELRSVDDNMARAAIVGLWVVTGVIAFFVISFAISVGASIIAGIKSL